MKDYRRTQEAARERMAALKAERLALRNLEKSHAMKVIFLDIDGVLNSKETPNPRKFPYIVDDCLLKRLLKLCERTGAQVVMSSTWRYDPVGLLAARHFGIPFIDVIPDMPGEARHKEIIAWLSAHGDVSRYAVIDDEDDELDTLPLFQPSASTGLTEEITGGVADYLNGKTDKDMRSNRFIRVMQNVRATLKGHIG